MDLSPTTDHTETIGVARGPGSSGRPALTVSGSRPAAINRRARWPGCAVFLLAMGALSVGFAVAAGTVPSSGQVPQVRVALAAVREWAPTIAKFLLGAGLVVVVVGVSTRLALRQRRQVRARVLAAASVATRVNIDCLTLRRAKWARRGRGLRSGVVMYRPAEAVVQDWSETLAAVLAPHVAAPVTVRWIPRNCRFEITPRPVVPLRIEERSPQLGKLVEALSHVIGTLLVDQRRSAVQEDGSVERLVARYAHTTRDIADTFRQRVQLVLDAKAPSPTGYWTVRWDPAGNEVTVLPSEPLPRRADYPVLMPGRDQQMIIPLGVGDGGQVVSWQPALFPHLLAVGPTGTGKTVFLFGLIISCLLRGWVIVLLDPKELSFRGFDPEALVGRGFAPWGGIVSVATTEAEMEEAIGFFHANMRNRYAAIKGFQISEDDLPPVLMIVDEAGELVERLNEYHSSEEKHQDLQDRAERAGMDAKDVAKPKGVKNPELRKVWSGLRLGRQARDIVCTATQRPDVSFIPGEARSNLTTRVGLGHLDGAALEMVFNTRAIQQRVYDYVQDPVTGQRQRQRVRGRATVDVGNGPQTIQTYYVPDPAKFVTGGLNAQETGIIERLHQMVEASRPQWAHQKEAPTVSARQLAAAARQINRDAFEAQETQHTEPTGVAIDGDLPYECLPADRLEVGQSVLIEVDSIPTLVVITEIEDDPYQDDDLQITYQVTGDEARTGQLGVTSLGRREQIALAE